MFKKIYNFVKNIVFSIFFIYAFNLISAPINIIIPINIITVLLVCFFGVPAILALVLIKILMF